MNRNSLVMNKLKHNLTTNGLGRIARGLREGIAATEIARSIHRST